MLPAEPRATAIKNAPLKFGPDRLSWRRCAACYCNSFLLCVGQQEDPAVTDSQAQTIEDLCAMMKMRQTSEPTIDQMMQVQIQANRQLEQFKDRSVERRRRKLPTFTAAGAQLGMQPAPQEDSRVATGTCQTAVRATGRVNSPGSAKLASLRFERRTG